MDDAACWLCARDTNIALDHTDAQEIADMALQGWWQQLSCLK
jgi:hypothetical protein